MDSATAKRFEEILSDSEELSHGIDVFTKSVNRSVSWLWTDGSRTPTAHRSRAPWTTRSASWRREGTLARELRQLDPNYWGPRRAEHPAITHRTTRADDGAATHRPEGTSAAGHANHREPGSHPEFDPRFEEVEEPLWPWRASWVRCASASGDEARGASSRAADRGEGGVSKQLDERLGSVRNLREEAAVSAELEMVKRSLQNDEQEASRSSTRSASRKIGRGAGRGARGGPVAGRAQDGGAREGAFRGRAGARGSEGEARRFAEDIDEGELKIYDAIRAAAGRRAVAELTEDGACGHCFGMVPLQLQNEIRHGAGPDPVRGMRRDPRGSRSRGPEEKATEKKVAEAPAEAAAEPEVADEALVEE